MRFPASGWFTLSIVGEGVAINSDLLPLQGIYKSILDNLASVEQLFFHCNSERSGRDLLAF
jgi:hypothetical protein